MIESFKHYLSVAFFSAKLSVQRQIEYPLFLVSWAVMVPFQWVIAVGFLKVVVEKFNSLGGWDFPQLAFIMGLGLLSHGAMVFFFIPTWGIDGMVVYGEYDRLLLRPLGVFFQMITRRVNFIGIFDFVPGVVVFLYSCKLLNFQWSLLNIVKIIVVVAGATLIRVWFFTIGGSIAFWTKKSHSFVDLGLSLLDNTANYPISIYPYFAQVLLTWLIPFGFISFYPACDFLGCGDRSAFPVGLALLTPLVGIVLFLHARYVFNCGLRRYESSGS